MNEVYWLTLWAETSKSRVPKLAVVYVHVILTGPSHTQPFPTHPSLCLPKTNSYSPHILGYVAFHWRVVNLAFQGLRATILLDANTTWREKAQQFGSLFLLLVFILFLYVGKSGVHEFLDRE